MNRTCWLSGSLPTKKHAAIAERIPRSAVHAAMIEVGMPVMGRRNGRLLKQTVAERPVCNGCELVSDLKSRWDNQLHRVGPKSQPPCDKSKI